MWFCYLLKGIDTNKTYIGATLDVLRRVAEHNGTKKGAKYTRGHKWHVICYISGFETKNQCLSFEKNFQRMYRQRRKNKYAKYYKGNNHVVSRLIDLCALVSKKWSRYVPEPALVPLQINWIIETTLDDEITVPTYITVERDITAFACPF
jgi:putative endonuclease